MTGPEVVSAVIGFAVALIGTIALVPLLRRYAMDVPNDRSSHVTPTPRGGGLAVVAAVALAVVVVDPSPSRETAVVLVAVVLLAVVGLADDLRSLPVPARFATQALVGGGVSCALVARWSDGWLEGGAVALLATLWLVAFTNAYNFMDGINGISGVTAIVAASWYVWLAHRLDMPGPAALAVALLGAASGFLPMNFPRARIFLGDVGSYGIGLLLGCLSILCIAQGANAMQAIAPLVVYVADTGWTLLRRMSRRERWWKAHREHVYQRLASGAAGRSLVTLLVGALSALVCLASVPGVPAGLGLAGVAVILVAYLAAPHLKIWTRA